MLPISTAADGGTTFAFNFLAGGPAPSDAPLPPAALAPVCPAEEVYLPPGALPPSSADAVEVGKGVQLLRGCIPSNAAASALQEGEVERSDLVPGVYEGGFKLWEGAVDLCRYLCEEQGLDAAALTSTSSSPFRGKRVLELGCGHGLPGILALRGGAEVHFQDYNKPVLQQLTIPNVHANLAAAAAAGFGRSGGSAKFFSGDWGSVCSHLIMRGFGGYYDYVFSAETIYNTASQAQLLECIKGVLQPPHGVAFISAKSYYFGVGGGTTSFTSLVKADGVLECSVVAVVEDGTNKREVLRLAFPDCIRPYFL